METTVEKERKEAGWSSWEKTGTIEKWRTSVKAVCVTRHKEDE